MIKEWESLNAKATPGPWYYAGCNTVHGSDHNEIAHPYNMDGDAELIIFLRNHSEALLELAKAAENARVVLGRHWFSDVDGESYNNDDVIEADEKLTEALAKLEGK